MKIIALKIEKNRIPILLYVKLVAAYDRFFDSFFRFCFDRIEVQLKSARPERIISRFNIRCYCVLQGN